MYLYIPLQIEAKTVAARKNPVNERDGNLNCQQALLHAEAAPPAFGSQSGAFQVLVQPQTKRR
jgi:hypothetical protein